MSNQDQVLLHRVDALAATVERFLQSQQHSQPWRGGRGRGRSGGRGFASEFQGSYLDPGPPRHNLCQGRGGFGRGGGFNVPYAFRPGGVAHDNKQQQHQQGITRQIENKNIPANVPKDDAASSSFSNNNNNKNGNGGDGGDGARASTSSPSSQSRNAERKELTQQDDASRNYAQAAAVGCGDAAASTGHSKPGAGGGGVVSTQGSEPRSGADGEGGGGGNNTNNGNNNNINNGNKRNGNGNKTSVWKNVAGAATKNNSNNDKNQQQQHQQQNRFAQFGGGGADASGGGGKVGGGGVNKNPKQDLAQHARLIKTVRQSNIFFKGGRIWAITADGPPQPMQELNDRLRASPNLLTGLGAAQSSGKREAIKRGIAFRGKTDHDKKYFKFAPNGEWVETPRPVPRQPLRQRRVASVADSPSSIEELQRVRAENTALREREGALQKNLADTNKAMAASQTKMQQLEDQLKQYKSQTAPTLGEAYGDAADVAKKMKMLEKERAAAEVAKNNAEKRAKDADEKAIRFGTRIKELELHEIKVRDREQVQFSAAKVRIGEEEARHRLTIVFGEFQSRRAFIGFATSEETHLSCDRIKNEEHAARGRVVALFISEMRGCAEGRSGEERRALQRVLEECKRDAEERLEEERAKFERAAKQCRADVAEAQAELAERHADQQNAAVKHQRAIAETTRLQSELDRRNETDAKLRSDLRRREQELNEARDAAAANTKQLTSQLERTRDAALLQCKAAADDAQRDERIASTRALDDLRRSHENEVAAMRARLEEAQRPRGVVAVRGHETRAQHELDTVQAELADLRIFAEKQKTKITDLVGASAALEEARAELAAELTAKRRLKGEIDGLRDVQARLQDAVATIRRQNDEITQLRGENGALGSQLQITESTANTYRSQLNNELSGQSERGRFLLQQRDEMSNQLVVLQQRQQQNVHEMAGIEYQRQTVQLQREEAQATERRAHSMQEAVRASMQQQAENIRISGAHITSDVAAMLAAKNEEAISRLHAQITEANQRTNNYIQQLPQQTLIEWRAANQAANANASTSKDDFDADQRIACAVMQFVRAMVSLRQCLVIHAFADAGNGYPAFELDLPENEQHCAAIIGSLNNMAAAVTAELEVHARFFRRRDESCCRRLAVAASAIFVISGRLLSSKFARQYNSTGPTPAAFSNACAAIEPNWLQQGTVIPSYAAIMTDIADLNHAQGARIAVECRVQEVTDNDGGAGNRALVVASRRF